MLRRFSTCTVETVCCFLPQCGQLKKHGKNQIKSKKTCFFLFLICFLNVFLICTFVQNYNRTGRFFWQKSVAKSATNSLKLIYRTCLKLNTMAKITICVNILACVSPFYCITHTNRRIKSYLRAIKSYE